MFREYHRKTCQSVYSRLLCTGPYLRAKQGLLHYGCEADREDSAAERAGWAYFDRTTGRQTCPKGIFDLMNFMGFISVNLAVLNLLPIPILDGGHIFFFLIEAVLGRPLSVKKNRNRSEGRISSSSFTYGRCFLYNDLARIDWSPVTSWFQHVWSRLWYDRSKYRGRYLYDVGSLALLEDGNLTAESAVKSGRTHN